MAQSILMHVAVLVECWDIGIYLCAFKQRHDWKKYFEHFVKCASVPPNKFAVTFRIFLGWKNICKSCSLISCGTSGCIKVIQVACQVLWNLLNCFSVGCSFGMAGKENCFCFIWRASLSHCPRRTAKLLKGI